MNPQLSYTFEDGNQLTADWGRRSAIGNEVLTVAGVWCELNKDYWLHSRGVANAIKDVRTLSSLKLDLPQLAPLKERAVEEASDRLTKEGLDVQSCAMLPAIYALDERKFKDIVLSIIGPKGTKHLDTLLGAVASSLAGGKELPDANASIANAKERHLMLTRAHDYITNI